MVKKYGMPVFIRDIKKTNLFKINNFFVQQLQLKVDWYKQQKPKKWAFYKFN